MRKIFTTAAAAAVLIGLPAAASAQYANANDTADAATEAANSGGPATRQAVLETTPAPQKDYPVCSATVTDGCIQPREAGMNYGNRPLDYWPGKPASQMTPEEKRAARPKD